ncbi:serine/threonine-protein kinase [Agromyces sp. MMS24-JH15]|uniref:serine/threonine-protein kinase n=1 Tax=Agromyces sp. MMS24-JH15 TaxID=3243765 RepID=UPI00374A050B
MTRRLPSTPPTLPGFGFVRVLGSGGFADVFLYEQNMPRRLVAVKVLLADLVNDDVRQMFQAEANLMAQLSGHPSILTVHQASVSADGRPYLVMEYCSSSLAQRYRAVQVPLSEALSIGVRIASAIETAHREGVLHRDIKPSNILTTAYGHPVLADFGIAATLGESASNESVGLSIPWSAPEVVRDDTAGTIATEVWSLGATVYSLLAGRSPFEVVGGDNSSGALIRRIERARLPATGRADVPASLEAVLARAMSRNPSARHASAMEFIRDLQGVEEELGLAQTPAEVALDDWAQATALDIDDRTKVSGGYSISSAAPDRRRRRQSAAGAPAVATGPRSSASAPAKDESSSARRRIAIGVGLAGALVLGLVAVGVTLTLTAERGIPVVQEVDGEVDGAAVVFSWIDPGIEDADAYLVRVDGIDVPAQRATSLRLEAEPGTRTCATVRVVRAGRTGAESPERCVAVGETG